MNLFIPRTKIKYYKKKNDSESNKKFFARLLRKSEFAIDFYGNTAKSSHIIFVLMTIVGTRSIYYYDFDLIIKKSYAFMREIWSDICLHI